MPSWCRNDLLKVATHVSRLPIKLKWQTIQRLQTIGNLGWELRLLLFHFNKKVNHWKEFRIFLGEIVHFFSQVYNSIFCFSKAETNLKPIWKLITQFFFSWVTLNTQRHLIRHTPPPCNGTFYKSFVSIRIFIPFPSSWNHFHLNDVQNGFSEKNLIWFFFYKKVIFVNMTVQKATTVSWRI